ncbi:BspA family leucine-rich repeat surface protein [Vibrio lentus]|nr:BspA family leucine-rich repeat surface protein [Vibrio lentus]
MKNMKEMFSNASAFNQDLTNWNVRAGYWGMCIFRSPCQRQCSD